MIARVRVTYTLPEHLRTVLKGGREVVVREAGSPTRLARDYEINVWWEDREVTEPHPISPEGHTHA